MDLGDGQRQFPDLVTIEPPAKLLASQAEATEAAVIAEAPGQIRPALNLDVVEAQPTPHQSRQVRPGWKDHKSKLL
jgi:hypothetical protein